VRRKYLENGPCQPRTCDFPITQIGEKENGLMRLVLGLNIVRQRIEHIAFIVSCVREKKDA
jgi:hypothetical protein